MTAKGEFISNLTGDVKYRCTADYYPCYDVSAFLGDNQENRKIFGSGKAGEDSDLKAVIDLRDFWESKVPGTDTKYKDALQEMLNRFKIEGFVIPLKLEIKGSGDIMGKWDADITRTYLNRADANGRPFELDDVAGDIKIKANLYIYAVYEFEDEEGKTRTKFYGRYLNEDLVFVPINKKDDIKSFNFEKLIKSYTTPYAKLAPIGEEQK